MRAALAWPAWSARQVVRRPARPGRHGRGLDARPDLFAPLGLAPERPYSLTSVGTDRTALRTRDNQARGAVITIGTVSAELRT